MLCPTTPSYSSTGTTSQPGSSILGSHYFLLERQEGSKSLLISWSLATYSQPIQTSSLIPCLVVSLQPSLDHTVPQTFRESDLHKTPHCRRVPLHSQESCTIVVYIIYTFMYLRSSTTFPGGRDFWHRTRCAGCLQNIPLLQPWRAGNTHGLHEQQILPIFSPVLGHLHWPCGHLDSTQWITSGQPIPPTNIFLWTLARPRSTLSFFHFSPYPFIYSETIPGLCLPLWRQESFLASDLLSSTICYMHPEHLHGPQGIFTSSSFTGRMRRRLRHGHHQQVWLPSPLGTRHWPPTASWIRATQEEEALQQRTSYCRLCRRPIPTHAQYPRQTPLQPHPNRMPQPLCPGRHVHAASPPTLCPTRSQLCFMESGLSRLLHQHWTPSVPSGMVDVETLLEKQDGCQWRSVFFRRAQQGQPTWWHHQGQDLPTPQRHPQTTNWSNSHHHHHRLGHACLSLRRPSCTTRPWQPYGLTALSSPLPDGSFSRRTNLAQHVPAGSQLHLPLVSLPSLRWQSPYPWSTTTWLWTCVLRSAPRALLPAPDYSWIWSRPRVPGFPNWDLPSGNHLPTTSRPITNTFYLLGFPSQRSPEWLPISMPYGGYLCVPTHAESQWHHETYWDVPTTWLWRNLSTEDCLRYFVPFWARKT